MIKSNWCMPFLRLKLVLAVASCSSAGRGVCWERCYCIAAHKKGNGNEKRERRKKRV